MIFAAAATPANVAAQACLSPGKWKKTWNAPSALYMPLFEFARLNAIPMDALNVDRALVSAVRENGWDAVPIQRREGVSRAAEPSAAYTDRLFDVFRQHIESKGGKAERSDDDFGRFVQAQTTWDRAMAESIASRLNRAGSERPLVVGVMGDGHVRHGHGVPHQLRAAGVTLISTLLPVAASTECSELRPGLADAVFAIPSLPASPP